MNLSYNQHSRDHAMWYFTIKKPEVSNTQYQRLQKMAALTEVEIFNEPYDNYCLFEVEKERYKDFMEYLDLEGIRYDVSTDKPSRDQLLEGMR